ncbi:glycoside hydrolase family 3 protein [Nocardioides speluncae]|uniref:glycoside hydrolase family 3 protein n=1 Tax=Nocardioides speluncae TaxID=2670337 RepID=UPI000D699AF3|nr:glycoside hydrolase family 3 N-terminal domain-containing protein [Nocardioides speluncae]
MTTETSVETAALTVLLPSFAGPSLPAEWAELLAEGLGGICLFGSNLTGDRDDVVALTAAIRAAGPAALIAIDEEGGDVTRLHIRTGSPVLGAAALGAVDDLSLTAATGRAVGVDLAAVGIDLDLGPVADVNSNDDNPVIGTRSFGADPDLVARHVAAWVGGLQEAGVAACLKHFPGHGDTAQDSHLTLPILQADEETLHARELAPFAAAIRAGAASVMTSHIVVPALDGDVPATFSHRIMSQLLRDELGFDGVVVSDALDMAGASEGRGIPEAAVLALAAGSDLLCIGPDKPAELVREIQGAVVAAVESGRLPAERLYDAAERVGRVRPTPTDAAAGTPMPGADQLRAAARAALIVDGELPDLTGARVASIETTANIAVGPGPWGVRPDLVVTPGEALPAGPLVVQVRDAHRRPEVGAMLAGLNGSSVVVEWGWPGPGTTGDPHSRVARICTRGNSRPTVAAVEEVLREAGWR